MIEFLKQLWWSVSHPDGRFDYLYALIGDMPGYPGIAARRRLMTRRFARCGRGLLILTGVHFRNPHRIECGEKVLIGNNVMIQAGGGLVLGDNVMLGPGAHIWTQNHRFDDLEIPVAEQGYEYAPVVLGRDCWVGTNAIILPGVTLPRGCVVSAGSVVGVKVYREFSIIMGNPARAIGFRGARKDAGGDDQ